MIKTISISLTITSSIFSLIFSYSLFFCSISRCFLLSRSISFFILSLLSLFSLSPFSTSLAIYFFYFSSFFSYSLFCLIFSLCLIFVYFLCVPFSLYRFFQLFLFVVSPLPPSLLSLFPTPLFSFLLFSIPPSNILSRE